jgi:hypothetical protein
MPLNQPISSALLPLVLLMWMWMTLLLGATFRTLNLLHLMPFMPFISFNLAMRPVDVAVFVLSTTRQGMMIPISSQSPEVIWMVVPKAAPHT